MVRDFLSLCCSVPRTGSRKMCAHHTLTELDKFFLLRHDRKALKLKNYRSSIMKVKTKVVSGPRVPPLAVDDEFIGTLP